MSNITILFVIISITMLILLMQTILLHLFLLSVFLFFLMILNIYFAIKEYSYSKELMLINKRKKLRLICTHKI